jgi:uncharacterized protein YgbK (DUF1537 family)
MADSSPTRVPWRRCGSFRGALSASTHRARAGGLRELRLSYAAVDGMAHEHRRCLANLEGRGCRELIIDASAAAGRSETASARLGFPSSAYVLALAGGTGVGSPLLNAIAGRNVSGRRAPADDIGRRRLGALVAGASSRDTAVARRQPGDTRAAHTPMSP